MVHEVVAELRGRRGAAVTCCLSPEAQSGELWEPKGVTGPPVLKDPLEKVCLEADRAALWAASEAAVGKWDLDL